MTTKDNLATNEEVLRYYEIIARTKKDTYIEEIPIDPKYNMNGLPRDEIQVQMESFSVWYEGDWNKITFRQQVKKELPELEEKFKKIKDKYFSPEEVTNREQIEFKKRLYIIKSKWEEVHAIHRQKQVSDLLKWDFLDCPKWDFQKRKRFVDFYDNKVKIINQRLKCEKL